jgi:uncharacterized LabA/DUF88 family protein
MLPRFEFREGLLQKVGLEFKQKRVDTLMAIDIVRMSVNRQVDTLVLLMGDSDMVPAIEVAKEAGVVVILYYSPSANHSELLSSCDERRILTKEIVEECKWCGGMATPVPCYSEPQWQQE